MNKKEKKEKLPLLILILSCVVYAPTSILINLVCSLTLNEKLLQAWANLIIFAISFIIGLFLYFLFHVSANNPIINYSATIYTIISFIINTFVFIIEDGKVWTKYSIILILCYSLIIALTIRYLKIKSYLIKSLIYYALSLASFLILTVVIAGYNTGNLVMIFIGSFTIFYVISSVTYFYVKRSFASYENEEKAYKRQFD
ncbi:MAG: hypothetical protein E7596_01120 [Ruminococcaceae bacterium]|nr:hypothetical protein [Oscillospiraceae bacterium]